MTEPQSFLDHLDELRTRIIRSCLAIGAGMLVAWAFVDRLADFVLAPTLRALPPGSSLIFTKPGEAFSFDLDIALIFGVVLAAPMIALYIAGIAIAWLARPRGDSASNANDSALMRLVVAGALLKRAVLRRRSAVAAALSVVVLAGLPARPLAGQAPGATKSQT